MSFNPQQFAIKKEFGSDWFIIRPAKASDRELVWEGYQNAPKEFFRQITEITQEMVEFWYPLDREIDFEPNQIFRSITRKIHYQDNEEIMKIDNDSKLAYLQALDTLIMYYQTKMIPKKETFELMGTLLITLWETEPFWRNIEKDIWFQDLELMVEDMKKIKEKLVIE